MKRLLLLALTVIVCVNLFECPRQVAAESPPVLGPARPSPFSRSAANREAHLTILEADMPTSSDIKTQLQRMQEFCKPGYRELVRNGVVSGKAPSSASCPSSTKAGSARTLIQAAAAHQQPTSSRPVLRSISDIGSSSVYSASPHSLPLTARQGVSNPSDSHQVNVQKLRSSSEVVDYAVNQAHADCFGGDPFPSAKKCKTCHPGHYREWSVSPHAYAQMSPVFNTMQNILSAVNQGTIGDFCIRCHTPTGMAMGEPIVMSNMDRHPSSREGITCVVCHRINQNWGKGAGRQALVAGGLDAPIYGPLGSEILREVLADPEKYGVLKTNSGSRQRARTVHRESVPFFALTTPATCGACHDVLAPNGFRLEDAFSEFKASPSAREKHQTCQDCHMGVSHGVASGYRFEPAAKVGNAWTRPRKRTNHMIVGPDYSILHPGIFPHNPEAVKEEHAQYKDKNNVDLGLATMRQWLLYDYKAGWGEERFEQNLSEEQSQALPKPWDQRQMRYRARQILNDQFRLLDEAKLASHQVLSAGYGLGDVMLDKADRKGIKFRIKVSNGTDGHSVPTGFDAERLVFLRVTVWDRNGKLVFVSGDLDPNGDVRDSHSYYVHNGELPLDRQLFSLQTRFLVRNVRGGEREQILPVPWSPDPLPFTRPETRPFTVLGRPVSARKHKQTIEPNGYRWARYHIKPSQLSGCGPYGVQVQLIAGMVPVNLVHAIQSVGFDYNLSAREVADRIVEKHIIVHSRQAVLQVDE